VRVRDEREVAERRAFERAPERARVRLDADFFAAFFFPPEADPPLADLVLDFLAMKN